MARAASATATAAPAADSARSTLVPQHARTAPRAPQARARAVAGRAPPGAVAAATVVVAAVAVPARASRRVHEGREPKVPTSQGAKCSGGSARHLVAPASLRRVGLVS